MSQLVTSGGQSAFIAALFTTAKTWKQPTCPSADERKDAAHADSGMLLGCKKEWRGSNLRVRLQRNGTDAAHAHSGMSLSHRKAWHLVMCSDTDGLSGHHVK